MNLKKSASDFTLYYHLNRKSLWIEAWALGTFMISAALCTIALDRWLPLQFISYQRLFTGMAMGLTAIGIIYSPWGKFNGVQMNPAFTLTMLWLDKIEKHTAILFVVFQFIGGAIALTLVNLWLHPDLSKAHVNYVMTIPQNQHWLSAFIAEVIISFLLFIMVLYSSNESVTKNYTGIFAGILIMLFITFESPLSGMSMNPARSFASALVANNFQYLWIYFTAPFIGMMSAGQIWKSWLCKRNHYRCSYIG